METRPTSLQSKFSRVIETCQSVSDHLRAAAPSSTASWKGLENARRESTAALSRKVTLCCENMLSSLLSWSVDVRISSQSLLAIEGTPIEDDLLSTLDEIEEQCSRLRRNHVSESQYLAISSQCAKCLANLQSKVQSIRMAEANVSHKGPYNRMRATVGEICEATVSMIGTAVPERVPVGPVQSVPDHPANLIASFASVSSDSDDSHSHHSRKIGSKKVSQLSTTLKEKLEFDAKMPISNQFSLSHELSRLVPFRPIVSAATQAVMFLARELQGSGSDIVIEEDLAAIFGRCRIQPSTESSFRTAVTHSGVSARLYDSILLRFGPGPTLNRGLTEKRYFPMVIQCSLLTSVCEKSSLAAAVVQIWDKQAEDAPLDYDLNSAPSHDGVIGVLRACEDQTASYDWSTNLIAVATILGISVERTKETLPTAIIQGATTMFPLVQSLPEDRLVHIHCGYGVCLLVVWAHHVLGLTVVVQTYVNDVHQEKKFGQGNENIVISDFPGTKGKIQDPSITLLERSNLGEIFTIRLESDEVPLHGVLKRPVKGYGKAVFESQVDGIEAKEPMVREMMLLCTAMTIRLSKVFFMISRANLEPYEHNEGNMEFDDEFSSDEKILNNMDLEINQRSVLDSAKLLFDRKDLKMNQLEHYMTLYSESPYNYETEPRGPIARLLDACFGDENRTSLDTFESMLPTLRYISVLILSFAHVSNLDSVSELPLSCSISLMEEHVISQQLLEWNGRRCIPIPEDSWFHAISLLMIGHKCNVDLSSTCLISDRGWSLYLSTFADADPSFTDKGSVMIQKGVPYKNGVWKHRVIDGPNSGMEVHESKVLHRTGEKFLLGSGNAMLFGRPLIGQAYDSFVINRTIKGERDGVIHTLRTGYREMCAALWTITKSSPCRHRSRGNHEVVVPDDCVLISDGNMNRSHLNARIIICQTFHNKAARWRALVTIAHRRDKMGSDGIAEQVMLRGNECCFKCAINELYATTGNWYLIL